MQTAEVPGIPGAELGVVAPPTLGDVVEESRQVEELQLGDAPGDGAAQWELGVVLRDGEATQVAQQGEGVLIHGVDMEEVVLHTPHDVGEGRDIGRQHPVAVHASQGMGEPGRGAQDLHEEAAGAQIRPEAVVDALAVLADEPDGAGADPQELGVGLEHVEDLQQGDRAASEDLCRGRLQVPAAGLKAFIDVDRRADRVVQQDGLAKELEQHLVEPAQLLHGAVVLLHELLDGQVMLAVAEAELVGQGALVVEQQAVLVAPGEPVQGEADAPQVGLALD